ncbi:MAG: hypothetical protein WEC75_13235 [Dehalococcoidia bacterium]
MNFHARRRWLHDFSAQYVAGIAVVATVAIVGFIGGIGYWAWLAGLRGLELATIIGGLVAVVLVMALGTVWLRERRRGIPHDSPPPSTPGAQRGVQFNAPVSVKSESQRGGQTAAAITNIGPQPRTLRGTAAREVIGSLQQLRGLRIGFDSLMGSGEADAFAEEVRDELKSLGCITDAHRTDTMHFPPRRGVYVIYYQDNEEIRGHAWDLARAISSLGVLTIAVLDTSGANASKMDLCLSVGSPASSLDEFSVNVHKGLGLDR